jgi:hypothetical protein
LDPSFEQIAPGICASIGEQGPRTYKHEGMNGNANRVYLEAESL